MCYNAIENALYRSNVVLFNSHKTGGENQNETCLTMLLAILAAIALTSCEENSILIPMIRLK